MLQIHFFGNLRDPCRRWLIKL